MSEAWIIDAVRTPRGKCKPETGGMGIATVLERL